MFYCSFFVGVGRLIFDCFFLILGKFEDGNHDRDVVAQLGLKY